MVDPVIDKHQALTHQWKFYASVDIEFEAYLLKNLKLLFCVSRSYEMSEKLHLICMKGFRAKIRCNLNISYLSKTQKK